MPWLIAFLISHAVEIGAIAGVVTIVAESESVILQTPAVVEKLKSDKPGKQE